MPELKSIKLAVLIDADNADSSLVGELLMEISRHGTASVKRAYGDWTTTNLKGWKSALHKAAIQPIQQFSYTTGKNSTDSALIIDAMDLLHAGNMDGFCIVSSDSDFTRLATRIREAGLVVYGFGQQKTPEAFVEACDKFTYTEILIPEETGQDDAAGSKSAKGENTGDATREPTTRKQWRELEGLFRAAVTGSAGENGWASLSQVGHLMGEKSPSFDPRGYLHQERRFKNLSELARNQTYLEVNEVASGKGPNSHLYVRLVSKS